MVGTRVDQIVAAVLAGMGRTVVQAGARAERHSTTLAGLLEVAATEQIALLQREGSLSAVTESLKGRVLPAVLWRDDGFAVVVAATEGDGLLLTIADPSGATREERCALTAVVDRLTALGAVGAGPALLLTPIEVEPVLGAGSADEHGDSHLTPVQRLWQLLRRERSDIGLVYLYATLNGLIYLTLPLGVQSITGLVSGGLILQPVVLLILFVIFGSLASGVLQLLQLSVVELLQQRIFAQLAFEFAFRLPRVRLESVRDEYLPEVMNRFFESVIIQKSLAKLLTESTTAALQVLFGLVLLTFYHPYFAAFSLLLLAVLALIFRVSGPRGLATSIAESADKYAAVRWLQEIGRSITAFKFAGSSAFAVERMDRHVTDYLHHRKAHFRVLVQQAMGMVVFKTVVIGTVLILGSLLVINRQITLGQFVASEIVIVMVMAGIEKLILSLSTLYDILTSVDKVGHVSELPVERDGGAALAPTSPAGMTLRTHDLRYRYPGAPSAAVDGITLDVTAGSRVVITGFDGAGQTTFLRVLAGLYHDFEGGLAYDGQPARSLELAAMRSQVGQLLSATDLFDGTLAENLRVGRAHLSNADLAAALDAVGAGDWLATLPNGLEAPIRSGGRSLPSHLVARLLLAQAIVGSPRLVVMDDFFQNLEAQTRDLFVELLMDRRRPWTVIAVSHDPAFLAAADRVLVMQAGRVVADGPLDEVSRTPAASAILGAVGVTS
ncbi:MAG: ATP-binding cassette domain-containing protein [Gemmatimonadetes bacterium]|nr:ATP-binding cassette domain-containing protein [Gemmatimonadota bacterium]